MMYKKLLALCVIAVWLIFSWWTDLSHAQTSKEVDMNSVWFRFCNDGMSGDQLKSDMVLSVEPWQDKNLCLYFFNVGDKAVDFVYWYSEGKIWKYWEKMCEADMTTGNNFSKLIPLANERRVKVSGKSYKTVNEMAKIPLGMSGVIYGCIAYKLEVPEYRGMWWVFDLVVRRTAHIDFFVWWEGQIKNSIKIYNLEGGVFTTNKQVKAEIDKDNKLKVSFFVGNEWNISQNVSISGEIQNILWFHNWFTVDAKTLTPWEKYTFTADLGILPFYKWPFTVKFNVQNTPVFDFDTSGMDPKLKDSWVINWSAQLFIFSRIAVIVIILLLFAIYHIFVPRRVKVQQ